MDTVKGEQVDAMMSSTSGLLSRRSFAKIALAAGAALVLPHAAEAASTPKLDGLFLYQTNTICTVLLEENYCTKGPKASAMRVEGSGFSIGGKVRVRVRDHHTDKIYYTAEVKASIAGVVILNTGIAIGHAGSPGAVRAYVKAYDYGKNITTAPKYLYITK
jgi:hypothetical protein